MSTIKEELNSWLGDLEKMAQNFCWMFQERGIETFETSWNHLYINIVLKRTNDWKFIACYTPSEEEWRLETHFVEKTRINEKTHTDHLCWPNEHLVGLSTPNWTLFRSNFKNKEYNSAYEGSMASMKTDEFFKKLHSFNLNLLDQC